MAILDKEIRIAIVGRNPLLEDELFSQLKAAGAADEAVISFDETPAGTLIDIDENEECRVYLPLSEDYLQDFEFYFLLTCSEKGRRLLNNISKVSGAVVIDLAGYAENLKNDPPEASDHILIPSAEAFFISEILKSKDSGKHKSLCWSVFQSASSEGKDGIKELFDQTQAVLNFKKPSSAVFKEQLAFNILPYQPEPEGDLEKTIRSLSGFGGFLTRNVVQIPTFLGSSISFLLEVEGKAESAKKTVENNLTAGGIFSSVKNLKAFYQPERKINAQFYLKALGTNRIWGWLWYDPFKTGAELAIGKMTDSLTKKRTAGRAEK
jgi:hypothetical protein